MMGSGARNRISLDRLAAVALLCLVAAAYGPLLTQYAAELWATAGYQLAPLVLLFAALIAWRQTRVPDASIGPRRWWAPALTAGLAVALLALAIAAQLPEMAAVSLLVLALAAMVRWSRAKSVGWQLGPWILACLVLRPPGDVDLLCFHSVARLTIPAAHRVLDALGVLHDTDGLSIMTAAGKLFVGGMGYGLFSPWSAVAVALAVCVWFQRSRADTVLMLTAGCGWFLLVDVVRICSTVLVSQAFEAAPVEGLVRAALDCAALLLLLLLIVSTERVLFLFGTALRLRRRKRTRRFRSAVKPLVVPMMVTVTGMTLDASGRLTRVVSKFPSEILPQRPSPVQPLAASTPQRGRRIDGSLVAIAYGLLCLVQAAWSPAAWLPASSAASGSKSAADAAMGSAMPAACDGWRLERSTGARWVYRREDLRFTFAVRARDPAWQDAAMSWVDRGWQVDPVEKSPRDHELAGAPIPYRETRLSKSFEPRYACLWASSWDPKESLSDWPAGWQAAAIASAEQAEGIWRAARRFGQAEAAHQGAAQARLHIEGSLVSYAALSPAELTAGRQLYCRLVEKLERSIASRLERQP